MSFVDISKVIKVLVRLPNHIEDKFHDWVRSVETLGIRVTRTVPGYHDEPLKGARFEQRSVRLNKAYRVIYREYKDGNIEIILVLEVNKHEY